MKISYSMALRVQLVALLLLSAATPSLAKRPPVPTPTPTSAPTQTPTPTASPTPTPTPTPTSAATTTPTPTATPTPTPTPTSLSCDTTSTQSRPISLGVSGGNLDSIGNGFCCTGTLGSLVRDASSNEYILSNNHVMVSADGQSLIIQPGLADTRCIQNSGTGVANLSNFVPISGTSNNTVDAAIAAMISGDVNTSGSILNIGTISGTPATATLNMSVQKMGRTTCLTTGSISSVNLTVSVRYPNACNLSFHGIATFVNQVEISGSGFSAGGDSGSLIVTTGSCPQAVGLLFAGSSTSTIANPIGDVLSAFGLTPVGTNTCVPVLAAASPASATSPSPATSPSGVNSKDVDAVRQVKERHEGELLKIPGVLGAGVGLSAGGKALTVKVLVEKDSPELRASLPSALEGVPVQVEETGPIVAY